MLDALCRPKMKLTKMKLSNHETGASAVEVAIILPLLLVLVFGIIEFSIILFNQAVITNASREAARQGILVGAPARTTVAEITQVVLDYSQESLITFGDGNPPTVNVAPTGPDCTTPIAGTSVANFSDCLIVTVSYQYDFLVLPAFINALGDWKVLTAETTMRYE